MRSTFSTGKILTKYSAFTARLYFAGQFRSTLGMPPHSRLRPARQPATSHLRRELLLPRHLLSLRRRILVLEPPEPCSTRGSCSSRRSFRSDVRSKKWSKFASHEGLRSCTRERIPGMALFNFVFFVVNSGLPARAHDRSTPQNRAGSPPEPGA